MLVSVVVPVYNAAGFVAEAVASALSQPEATEVILVDDGSTDNSRDVCQALAERYDRVHLLRHPGGGNRGAGASRNLGMRNVTCDYIAFLDADDWYVPGRFAEAERVFQAHPECDGVYGAVGIHFDDEQARQRWLTSDMAEVQMTTMTPHVPPEGLFRVLTRGGAGHIHIDGLVIRRSVLARSGYMNEVLRLHQDSEFTLRLAAVGRLMPGNLSEPVAVRRVHKENRVSAPRSTAAAHKDRMRMWMAVYRWCRRNGLGAQQHLALKRMIGERAGDRPNSQLTRRMPTALAGAVKLMSWPMEYPEVILERYYWIEALRSIWRVVADAKSGGEGP